MKIPVMQEYQIRLMTIEDYEQVYALWSITEGMALRGYDDSAEGIAKFLKKNPTSNFVAVMDGEIVGVIMCGMDGALTSTIRSCARICVSAVSARHSSAWFITLSNRRASKRMAYWC